MSTRPLGNALGKTCSSNFPNQRVEVRVHPLDVLLVGNDAIMGAASADARTSSSPISLGVASGVHMPAQASGWFYSSWVVTLHLETGLSTTAHTAGLPVSTSVVKSAMKLKSSLREALLTELAVTSECSVEEMLTDGLYDAHSFLQPIVKSAVAELEQRVYRKQQADVKQRSACKPSPSKLSAAITEASNSKNKAPIASPGADRWGMPLPSPSKSPLHTHKPKSAAASKTRKKKGHKSPGAAWLKANPLTENFGLIPTRKPAGAGAGAGAASKAVEKVFQFEEDDELHRLLAPEAEIVDPSFHELVADVTNITNKLGAVGVNSEGMVVEAMTHAHVTIKDGQLTVTPSGASPAVRYAEKEVERRIGHHISSSDQIHNILEMVSSKRSAPNSTILPPAPVRFDRRGQVYRK